MTTKSANLALNILTALAFVFFLVISPLLFSNIFFGIEYSKENLTNMDSLFYSYSLVGASFLMASVLWIYILNRARRKAREKYLGIKERATVIILEVSKSVSSFSPEESKRIRELIPRLK